MNCFAAGEEEGDSTMADTETTTADTTFVKQRFTDPASSDISSIYPANSSSMSAITWDNRMRTDAKVIFDRLKDDRSTSSSIEMKDIATQVSLSSDTEIELEDMSILRVGDDVAQSRKSLDVAETSFMETRSGLRYEKVFVLKK